MRFAKRSPLDSFAASFPQAPRSIYRGTNAGIHYFLTSERNADRGLDDITLGADAVGCVGDRVAAVGEAKPFSELHTAIEWFAYLGDRLPGFAGHLAGHDKVDFLLRSMVTG